VSKTNSLATLVLRWPLVWGGLASLGFYMLVHNGVLSGELVHRYFASHPVEYLAMTMFFVGLAALVLKGIDLFGQFAGINEPLLGQKPAQGQPVAEAQSLLAGLAQGGDRRPAGYLRTRLWEALEFVHRRGSAETLDEHLRYAADLDAVRMHSSYALVRIIIWAIPILGFLGTVVGITLAIAKLGPQDLESSLPLVIGGLKVAFDTTALALSLAIILMFAQFISDRFETRLLALVDERTSAELVGRFEEAGTGTDPQAASIRRMADAVIESSGRLVERQAAVWQSSLEEAQKQWSRSGTDTAQQLQEALAGALNTSLERHAAALRQSEEQWAGRAEKHWNQFRGAVSDNAQALVDGLSIHADKLGEIEAQAAHRAEQLSQHMVTAVTQLTTTMQQQYGQLNQQGEVLHKVVQAVADIKSLEAALNDNLAALAKEHNFEETVMSLSAALSLLTAQLRGSTEHRSRIDLQSGTKPSQAA